MFLIESGVGRTDKCSELGNKLPKMDRLSSGILKRVEIWATGVEGKKN
jgi:hypothetical protein